MVVEIRLYKKFDTDLVALVDAGYSVSTMMRDAVVAYANSSPINFILEEPLTYQPDDKKNVHTRFIVPDDDIATCQLLRGIRYGFKNTFCKMVLRNAMVQQNLMAFFANTGYIQHYMNNLSMINRYSYSNLVSCAGYKNAQKQMSLLGGVPAETAATPSTAFPNSTVHSFNKKKHKKKTAKNQLPNMNQYGQAQPANPYMGSYPMQGMPMWGNAQILMPTMGYQGMPYPMGNPSMQGYSMPTAEQGINSQGNFVQNIPIQNQPEQQLYSGSDDVRKSARLNTEPIKDEYGNTFDVDVHEPEENDNTGTVQSSEQFEGIKMASNTALLDAFDKL